MWYIFPQYKGLGRSDTSKLYAIKIREVAVQYFKDDLLGKRLKQITEALLLFEGRTANETMSAPDDVKLKSCLLLFHLVQNETDLFKKVLDKYIEGKISHRTKKFLS